jgi:hypothetical protein
LPSVECKGKKKPSTQPIRPYSQHTHAPPQEEDEYGDEEDEEEGFEEDEYEEDDEDEDVRIILRAF